MTTFIFFANKMVLAMGNGQWAIGPGIPVGSGCALRVSSYAIWAGL